MSADSSQQDQKLREALSSLLSTPDLQNSELVLSLKVQLLSKDQRRQIEVLLKAGVKDDVIADATLAEISVINFLRSSQAQLFSRQELESMIPSSGR